jgi:chromate transporter
MDNSKIQPVTLKAYLLYFLRLGSLGFGGPIVLTSHMRRDLVDMRKWVLAEEFENGLALAQLAPGPLAAQLAIFLGWLRFGNIGATLVAVAFIAPSFLIVLALSALYVEFSGLVWIQGAFYGIGAAVIAIMVLGVYKLTKRTLGKDRFLWATTAISTIITAATEREIVWIFIAAGVLSVLVKTPPSRRQSSALAIAFPAWMVTGFSTPADGDGLWRIFTFFAKAGAFIFGSGLAIVPFLHAGVVQEFGWLSEQQFIDAVAVAMITPGPVVITVAFIGYLVAGGLGASAAALGVFLPCYLFVIIPAPYFQKYSKIPRIKAFIGGVTAASVGAIAGAAFVLGRRAVIDVPTVVIFVVSLVALWKVKSLPEPILILIAGLLGLALKVFT